MSSICVAEIKARYSPETTTVLMHFLIELDRRGLIKSEMKTHMNHGYERVWSAKP